MLKAKEVIGLPLVTSDTGEEIGHVKEVIVHRAKNCVVGFLVRRAGWFQPAKVLPFSQVMSFDDSAVIVLTTSSVGGLDQVPDVSRLLKRKPLAGSMLISSNGHAIGRISDFSFDELSGKLNGFEVVTGSTEDTMSDPEFVPLNEHILIGRVDVIASEQAVARLLKEATVASGPDATREDSPAKKSFEKSTDPYIDVNTVLNRIDPHQLKVARDGSSLKIEFNTIGSPNDLSIAGYHTQLLSLLAQHPDCSKLVFDVSNIKVLPSVMLGLLANLRKKVDHLEILNPTPDGREALKILGFDKFMTIRDDHT